MYHFIPKGNNGMDVFADDVDRLDFFVRLAAVTKKYGVDIVGYCLMSNHVHLVVVVRGNSTSEAMKILLGGYSRASNKRHGRRGNLWQAHFHHEPILTDRHLIAALRYVDLNPVAVKVPVPEEWRWSSYRAHIGLENPPAFLANDDFLRLLGRTPDTARAAYAKFMREGVPGITWPPSRPPRRG